MAFRYVLEYSMDKNDIPQRRGGQGRRGRGDSPGCARRTKKLGRARLSDKNRTRSYEGSGMLSACESLADVNRV